MKCSKCPPVAKVFGSKLLDAKSAAVVSVLKCAHMHRLRLQVKVALINLVLASAKNYIFESDAGSYILMVGLMAKRYTSIAITCFCLTSKLPTYLCSFPDPCQPLILIFTHYRDAGAKDLFYQSHYPKVVLLEICTYKREMQNG